MSRERFPFTFLWEFSKGTLYPYDVEMLEDGLSNEMLEAVIVYMRMLKEENPAIARKIINAWHSFNKDFPKRRRNSATDLLIIETALFPDEVQDRRRKASAERKLERKMYPFGRGTPPPRDDD
jgi:hypothetical protein